MANGLDGEIIEFTPELEKLDERLTKNVRPYIEALDRWRAESSGNDRIIIYGI